MIMSQTVTDIASHAALSPALLFNASVGDAEDGTRSTGLVLTVEQVKSLKTYEIAGLALPTRLSDVISYLGYRDGAGRGLSAVDFQKTFTIINDHARLWNPLRTDLLSVGDKLEIFAKKMQVYGAHMERLFARIDSTGLRDKYNIETLEDLRNLQLEPGDEFPTVNASHRRSFGSVLDRILMDIQEQEEAANGIKNRLASFGETLAVTVQREIRLKLASIDNNSLGADIKALQTRIDQRARSIDEKNKEYNDLIGKAVGSITSGLIMVIYTSVRAEEARKERNRLRKAQEADIALMETKHRILASLGRVRLHLQDLDLIVIDADIATKNLTTVWNHMTAYVTTSRKQADLIDNGYDLFLFEVDFDLVVKPWNTIEKNARALLAVFNQADEEFRQEHGVQ
jgi:tetrahydromethanopterin S-methyltransferase subunit G